MTNNYSWYVVNNGGNDFTLPIEDMLSNYLQQQWAASVPVAPQKSIAPPGDFVNKVRFGDWYYDYFSTYYIRVKEEDTEFNNDLIIDNCFQLQTTVDIDVTARRLTYGESFAELNNMRLEVIRILGNYRPDDIPGIHLIEIETPGERDIEKLVVEGGGKTIWYLRVKAVCHYIKAFTCLV